MGMSRQTAFTLMLLLAFSVIVPGSAGYLSVKMEAIGQAHRELLTLESRLRHEKLAARIKRMERVYRTRRLQPVAPSGREPSEPVRSSRVEPGAPLRPGAAAVPIEPGAEQPYERWPRARRPETRPQDLQGPGAAWQSPQGPEARLLPEPRSLTAQRGVEPGTAEEAFPQEQWSQLERRGRARQYLARLTDDGSVFATPDSIGGEAIEEGLLPSLSQTETRAN